MARLAPDGDPLFELVEGGLKHVTVELDCLGSFIQKLQVTVMTLVVFLDQKRMYQTGRGGTDCTAKEQGGQQTETKDGFGSLTLPRSTKKTSTRVPLG